MPDINAVVLGIDAAWTLSNPSGVALAIRRSGGWQAVAASASYGEFMSVEDIQDGATARPSGSSASVGDLLAAAERRCGKAVHVIAVDMPLANTPILARRASDNLVSSAYGSRKCSTHTPRRDRPGKISDRMRQQACEHGYPLIVSGKPRRGLIEVYPHPALVELTGAPERLPYKVSNIRKYWRELNGVERRVRLFEQWRRIAQILEHEISGCEALLTMPASDAAVWQLKAYEDRLDALVCAVVAARFLEERCIPFGDENSAIWIPMPQARRQGT